ncbi:MAG TPA: nuclear transport factor 2 family protein [Verrucomicrobiae bacterium]|nr:nuclear transport factor 2 family protein [Verrucomicrobiae bacterium]
MTEEDQAILSMERAALDRWGNGDPSGFLEISAPDVVYFDNTLERRLDGLGALTSLYEKLRGKINLERYDLLNPKVQLCADAAVLTYNFVGYAQGKAHRWNCTEVYRRKDNTWRIIQTHWSVTQHSP